MTENENNVVVYEAFIEDMLKTLQANLDELNTDKELSEFEQGRHLAYTEMFDIIKTRHSIILEVIAED